jgi:hypothetical protein
LDWKDLKINGIAKIEKCVAEFDVWELNLTPWGKFKVKIFEGFDGNYTGHTNLMLRNEDGSPEAGVGFGSTVEEALNDTINYFLKMLGERENINKNDFESADPYDF